MSTIKTLTDSSEPLPQIRQQSFALDHLPPSEKGLPGNHKEAADSLIPLPVDVPSTIRKKPAMDSTARSPGVPPGHRQQCRTMMKKRKMSDEHPNTNMEVVSAEKDFSVFPKPLPLKLRFADEGRDHPPGVDNDANVTDVLKEAEEGGREATPPTVPPRMLFRQPSSSMPRGVCETNQLSSRAIVLRLLGFGTTDCKGRGRGAAYVLVRHYRLLSGLGATPGAMRPERAAQGCVLPLLWLIVPLLLLTFEQITRIHQEDDEDVSAIYIEPPEVTIYSDEDSADEDSGGLIENLSSRQLRAAHDPASLNLNSGGKSLKDTSQDGKTSQKELAVEERRRLVTVRFVAHGMTKQPTSLEPCLRAKGAGALETAPTGR
ncbi:hypothetical protein HPB52_010445 [Rhipicephalus sanguineus]|uniref:Uncharacterized protein n=1 Tax=Rhipicephalus sanguineus TaxID=34632 RepID=A0A9D4PR41_RHISA|nr:hypothetical protein HPB52_010445 [Rhipicephalus sanguineus]